MERYKKLSNFLNLYFTYLHSWMYLDGMQGEPAALDSPLHVLPLAGEVVDVAGKNHLGHLVSAERVFNHLNLTFQFKDLCKCACWHSSGIFMAKQKRNFRDLKNTRPKYLLENGHIHIPELIVATWISRSSCSRHSLAILETESLKCRYFCMWRREGFT